MPKGPKGFEIPTQIQVDTVLQFQAFNYDVGYDTLTGVITIGITTPKTQMRYHLPFDRLSFAAFVKTLQGAADQISNASENGNGPNSDLVG